MFGTKGKRTPEEIYTENAIRTASREQLLLITYDIGIQSCLAAEAALSKRLYDETNEHLKRAQNVVRELMITLRVSRDNPVTMNLMRLYDFMYMTLIKANTTKDSERIAEVRGMFEELKATWEQSIVKIAEEYDETKKSEYLNNLPSVQRSGDRFTARG